MFIFKRKQRNFDNINLPNVWYFFFTIRYLKLVCSFFYNEVKWLFRHLICKFELSKPFPTQEYHNLVLSIPVHNISILKAALFFDIDP